MPINTSMMAFELADRSRRMNLPTSRSKGVLAAAPGNYGGSGTSESSRTVTERSWTPSGPQPTRPDMGTFQAPEYSDSEVASLRQRHAGPGIRKLRDQTLNALRGVGMTAQGFENPNVRRMTVRQALQGYGSGLGQILASAQSTAMNQYGQKYNKEYDAAYRNFEADRLAKMTEYNNLWTAWANQGKERTTVNQTGTGSTNVNVGSGGGVGLSVQPSQPRVIQPPTWSPSTGRVKAMEDYAAGRYGPFNVTNPG